MVDGLQNSKIPNIFLNIPFGSAAHFIFATNFCPKTTINNITKHSPTIYATRLLNQVKKLTGKTCANINPYVGLQLEKTGQSETQTNILHQIHFFCDDFASAVFAEFENFPDIFFQIFGNKVIIQKNTIIIPDAIFKYFSGVQINNVVAFNNNVKTSTEKASERIIIYGLDLLSASPAEAHNITGKSGKTQGAKIVRTPAKNDKIINSTLWL